MTNGHHSGEIEEGEEEEEEVEEGEEKEEEVEEGEEKQEESAVFIDRIGKQTRSFVRCEYTTLVNRSFFPRFLMPHT